MLRSDLAPVHPAAMRRVQPLGYVGPVERWVIAQAELSHPNIPDGNAHESVFAFANGRCGCKGIQLVAVRYAWYENPPRDLVNSVNLPASLCRTDDWPLYPGEGTGNQK